METIINETLEKANIYIYIYFFFQVIINIIKNKNIYTYIYIYPSFVVYTKIHRLASKRLTAYFFGSRPWTTKGSDSIGLQMWAPRH